MKCPNKIITINFSFLFYFIMLRYKYLTLTSHSLHQNSKSCLVELDEQLLFS